jgi:small multidrug resistance pump
MFINLGVIYLLLAIIGGCLSIVQAKKSKGLTILLPSFLTIAFAFMAIIGLTKSYTEIPLSISYGTYAAVLILFSVVFGYFAYNEKPSKCTMIGISFIVIGLLFIHVVSKMNIIN